MAVAVGVSHLIWTYVATIVLMAATHSVIAARADRVEGYVVMVVTNVLVIHALADEAFAGHVVKQAATIWMYRA